MAPDLQDSKSKGIADFLKIIISSWVYLMLDINARDFDDSKMLEFYHQA